MYNFLRSEKHCLSMLFWTQGVPEVPLSHSPSCRQRPRGWSLWASLGLPHPPLPGGLGQWQTLARDGGWEEGEIWVFLLSHALLGCLSKAPTSGPPLQRHSEFRSHCLLLLLRGSVANSSPLLLIPGDCTVHFDFLNFPHTFINSPRGVLVSVQ